MKKFVILGVLFFLGALYLTFLHHPVEAAIPKQSVQEGQALFQQKCAACHTVGGGKLVGPDLQGVVARRDLNWLQKFIAAPDQMIASGDALAVQLLAENNNLPMPNLALSDQDVLALIAYLESPGAASQPANPPPVLPAGNAAAGKQLFSGEMHLSAGGPACISCHSVQGIGPLEGGSLGPDLTQVVQRFGEAGLAANLNQFTFPTMVIPFLNRPLSPQEQADLLAYFLESNARPPTPAGKIGNVFMGLGTGLALLLFGVMLIFRPRRKRSVLERLPRR